MTTGGPTDLVTFGETMLRLTPPRGDPLSRTDDLAVHVGGAESNVAAAAANLGLDAAWLSVLPESPLAERIVHGLRGEEVEPIVRWADHGRVGTYYFEPGVAPLEPAVHYDRRATPIRSATPADLPLERIREAEAFFTTGITPALSETLVTTTSELLAMAREAGTTTVFDVNFRGKLWDPKVARETLAGLFTDVDILFVADRDLRTVFGSGADPEATVAELRDEHGLDTVVVTRGIDGALAVGDETHEQPAFPAETVDPVGSGDAFAAGYLAAWLRGADVPTALERGAAAAAIKRTVEGDMAPLSPAAVQAVVDGEPIPERPEGSDDGDGSIER